MSGLSAFALGFTAARAIKGRTWAGANVQFEPSTPVTVTAPLICVYCARGRAEVAGGDILNGAGDARLRFECFLPAKAVAAGVSFDSEAGQALLFALLWRQIEVVLLTDMDISPWAQLWRQFRLRIHAIDAARDLYELDKGQRVAVQVVELHCETLAEPPIGVAPCGVWADLVTAMQADSAEVASLASLFAAQIQGSPSALPDWQVDMGLLGASDDAIQAIGLGPLDISTPALDMGPGQAIIESETYAVSPLPDL